MLTVCKQFCFVFPLQTKKAWNSEAHLIIADRKAVVV